MTSVVAGAANSTVAAKSTVRPPGGPPVRPCVERRAATAESPAGRSGRPVAQGHTGGTYPARTALSPASIFSAASSWMPGIIVYRVQAARRGWWPALATQMPSSPRRGGCDAWARMVRPPWSRSAYRATRSPLNGRLDAGAEGRPAAQERFSRATQNVQTCAAASVTVRAGHLGRTNPQLRPSPVVGLTDQHLGRYRWRLDGAHTGRSQTLRRSSP